MVPRSALRLALPDARISLFASPAGSQIAPLLPWIDEIVAHRAVWQDASGSMPLDPQREMQFIEELRARRFDAAVIFTSFSQSPYPPAWACYLAGIPIRLGQSRDFGGSVLRPWVKPLPGETHQVDRNLHLLESAGFAPAERHLELRVPDDIQTAADALLAAEGVEPHAPFVVLAPGASCPARMYSPQHFGAVARGLARQLRAPVVVVGAPREAEMTRELLAAAGSVGLVSLVGRTSVPELAAILRRSALLVASHSGPMHIADAFRRPMVLLFSGTDLGSQWLPRGSPLAVLRRPTACTPCYRFHCLYRMECLAIDPEEVVRSAVDMVLGHSF